MLLELGGRVRIGSKFYREKIETEIRPLRGCHSPFKPDYALVRATHRGRLYVWFGNTVVPRLVIRAQLVIRDTVLIALGISTKWYPFTNSVCLRKLEELVTYVECKRICKEALSHAGIFSEL